MILPPKPKNSSKKTILNKTKSSNQRLLESSKCFFLLLLTGVFGFGGIWFILWRIDNFNFATFFRTYLAKFILEKVKNMNPHKFVVLKNYNHNKKKKKWKKNMTNFTAIFVIWQWPTKYIFSSINKNPHARFFLV